MPNPFESKITPNPEALQKQAEHQKQQEFSLRHSSFAANEKAEFLRYNTMVVEVLQELRDTVYPTFKVRNKRPVFKHDDDPKYHELQVDWAIGSWGTRTVNRGRSSDTEPVFQPQVGVDLVLSESGEAQAFKAILSGPLERGKVYDESGYPKAIEHQHCRELQADLNQEALVQILIELHATNPRAQAAHDHIASIEGALERLRRSSHFRKCFEDSFAPNSIKLAPPDWSNCVRVYTQFEPVTMPKGARIGPWKINHVAYADPETGRKEEEYIHATVNLVVNEDNVATHYEYILPYQDAVASAPLDEEALFLALEQSVMIAHARMLADQQKHEVKTSPPKRRWFNR